MLEIVHLIIKSNKFWLVLSFSKIEQIKTPNSNQKKKNVANYISENKKTYDTIWDIVSRTMKVKDDIITNIDTEGGLPFSQSLGDEEVGEGYVLSDEGNLIKLVDRSKFTKANRAVVREQVEFDDELLDLEDSETHVFTLTLTLYFTLTKL